MNLLAPFRLLLLIPALVVAGCTPSSAPAPSPAPVGTVSAQAPEESVFAETAVEDSAFVNRADRARNFGSETAPNTILEIVDFSCPTCRRFFEEKADSLKTEWVDSGEARIVHIMSPLPQLLRSWHGASAAVCAAGLGGQEAYLAMTRQLYLEQEEWRHLGDPLPQLTGFADAAGLPAADFRSCLLENRAAPLILRDLRVIAELRVSRGLEILGTPTFVINGQEAFYGVQPMSMFREAVARTSSEGGS